MASVSLQSLHPFLEKKVTELHTEEGKSTIHSHVHDHGSGVILCAVHGYPQSSYMWRHVIAQWKDKYSIFLPELPGYGISETESDWDKRKIGKLLVEALQRSFKDGASRPIVWCSHDRGARIGHRLLASKAAGHENIISAVFMDIVPTRECWRGFQNPAACIGYFHWPFLAQPDAPALLQLMGGDVFTDAIFKKGSGANEAGAKLIYSDGAVDHYNALFKTKAAIEGSCADYKYGGMQECKEQDEDQAADRKIDVPLLVLYSASNIGRACNVEATWKPYTHAELTAYGIGDDIGHYLPESAPEVVAQQVITFVDKTVSVNWTSKLS